MQGNVLYLPSTPLNVLLSCAVATRFAADCHSEIWLIDQKSTESNPYYQALLNWQSSPFLAVKIFPGKARGKEKLRERQSNFLMIDAELDIFLPYTIVTGSDRRIEFQYVMHQLKMQGQQPHGVYLDDGLYSYAGRPYSWIKDPINSLLKKISYGFWWQEPKTVGASAWIEQAWLFQPDLAVKELQNKVMHKLPSDWFTCEQIVSLSRILADILQFDIDSLIELDVIILVPHPNNIKKIPDYQERVVELIRDLSLLGYKIGVKYHPRMEQNDALRLVENGAEVIIPTQLAFEFCLPVFKQGCLIIGDVGTTMLTSKWLRSDLDVKALLDPQNEFQQSFIPLMDTLGINVISSVEELLNEARN